MTSSFDVAIVGAGPAGAWAAFCLASNGARVALIDGSHPREKPCGGGVSARALKLLDRLPGGMVPPAVDVTRAHFAADGLAADVPLERRDARLPALVIASRRDLDGAILRAAVDAGATHVARRVIDIARLDAGWTITTDTSRLTAGWLVGADGANSLVRRRTGRPFDRSQLSIASGHYVHGETGRHIDIEFTQSPPGYLWAFPRHDHIAVGICGQANETSSAALLAASTRWIADRYPSAAGLARYSWPIPSLTEEGLSNETPAGERWFLVGDAAGLVDPITREGIFYALQSADLAASSLKEPRAASRYAEAVRGTIHRELRTAARMKTRFFGPRFSRLLVQSLQRSDRIAAIMAGLVSGQQTYDGLRRRLVLTREWRLAFEYLRLSRAK